MPDSAVAFSPLLPISCSGFAVFPIGFLDL